MDNNDSDNYVYKSIMVMRASAILLTCSMAGNIYSSIDTGNIKESYRLQNKRMLTGSKPIQKKIIEYKANGSDTLKTERIDTVGWIVPDSLMIK